jgi:tetratricopeptide (TPR) repeat protein
VSRWSNPFVNLGVLVLVAGCQSAPHEEAPAAREVSAPNGSGAVDANAGAAPAAPHGAPASGASTPQPAATNPAGPKLAAPNAGAPKTAAGVAIGGSAATGPVPARAEQQYADALRLMRAGKAADAAVEFKQLTLAYPELSGPYVNLGLVYLQSSLLPQAEEAFKAALDHNPGSVVAANELGIAERRLGKFKEAEAAYQRTIASDPGYAPAYLNLGVLYDLYLAEPQKALDQFEHYIQLAGENKQVAGWVVELRKRVGAPAPAAKKDPA